MVKVRLYLRDVGLNRDAECEEENTEEELEVDDVKKSKINSHERGIGFPTTIVADSWVAR